MRTPTHAVVAVAFAIALCALPAVSQAQSSRWGSSWDDAPGTWATPDRRVSRSTSRKDPREGRVDVSRFVAEGDAAQLLGHGPVTVSSQVATAETQPSWSSGALDDLPQAARAPFEAAVVDRLVAAGYDTRNANPEGGQVAELRVTREVLASAEEKRKPVSGAAAMEVGTRGSGYGLALNVDMSKPRAALLSTRLEARIRDKASGKLLWEGRAAIATREGDDDWTDGKIAGRLASALFDGIGRASQGSVPTG